MEKIFLILIFLGCVLLPFSPAIATIVFMVFAGGVVIENGIKKNFPDKKEWRKLLILPSFFFLWALIGTLLSSYPSEGFHIVRKFIPFMVFSLAYIFAKDSLKRKAPSYVSSGIIIGITGSLLYLLVTLGINFSYGNENSILNIFSHRFTYFNFVNPLKSHPTYFSVWILLANYFVFNSKKINNYLKAILFGLFFIGMVFTLSRVGLLLYGLQILGAFFYLSAKWKKIYIGGLIVFLVLGIYLYKYQLANFYLLQRFSIELAWDTDVENTEAEINNRIADDSRIARWTAIWQTIEEKPIFGYGTGSEKGMLEKTYSENGLTVSLERMYNTHNQFLFYMLENGILGLILFLAYFIANIIAAIKRKDMLIISFIIGILIIFMFENYMYRSMGYLTIALFLSFMRISKK